MEKYPAFVFSLYGDISLPLGNRLKIINRMASAANKMLMFFNT
jgi:hypothetical protein